MGFSSRLSKCSSLLLETVIFLASLWLGLVSCVLKPVTVIDSTTPRPLLPLLLSSLFFLLWKVSSIFWLLLVPEFIFEMRLYRELNPLSVHAFHSQNNVLHSVHNHQKHHTPLFEKASRQSKRVSGKLFCISVSIHHVWLSFTDNVSILSLLRVVWIDHI